MASLDLAVNGEACALTDVETSFWRVVKMRVKESVLHTNP